MRISFPLDFFETSYQAKSKTLFSWKDLSQEEKDILKTIFKYIKNEDNLMGRNKESWTKILSNGMVKEINSQEAIFFKSNKVYHFHTGNSETSLIYLKYKLPAHIKDFSLIEEKNIKNTNYNGLVSDFLIHYEINNNDIIIHLISRHKCWTDFFNLAQHD